MRLLMILILGVVLAGCAGNPATSGPSPQVSVGTSASDAQKCRVTEQEKCLELDILNVLWEPGNVHLAGLDQPYANQAERSERVTRLGADLYTAWKAGEVEAAPKQTFTVYIWNPAEDVHVDRMSQYRLVGKDGSVTRHQVVEASTNSFVAAFDPTFNLGKPHRALEVTAMGAGVGIQFPWELVGDRTYVLICGDDSNVYPDRQTADQGLWITPEYLNWMKGNGAEYALVPFVSKGDGKELYISLAPTGAGQEMLALLPSKTTKP